MSASACERLSARRRRRKKTPSAFCSQVRDVPAEAAERSVGSGCERKSDPDHRFADGAGSCKDSEEPRSSWIRQLDALPAPRVREAAPAGALPFARGEEVGASRDGARRALAFRAEKESRHMDARRQAHGRAPFSTYRPSQRVQAGGVLSQYRGTPASSSGFEICGRAVVGTPRKELLHHKAPGPPRSALRCAADTVWPGRPSGAATRKSPGGS